MIVCDHLDPLGNMFFFLVTSGDLHPEVTSEVTSLRSPEVTSFLEILQEKICTFFKFSKLSRECFLLKICTFSLFSQWFDTLRTNISLQNELISCKFQFQTLFLFVNAYHRTTLSEVNSFQLSEIFVKSLPHFHYNPAIRFLLKVDHLIDIPATLCR